MVLRTYKRFAQLSINYINFPYDIVSLNNFRIQYISTYDNLFSGKIQLIKDFTDGKIESIEEYKKKVQKNTINGKRSFIVYRIIDKKRFFVRIGYASDSPADRWRNYFRKAFAPNINLKRISNCHLSMRILNIPSKVEKFFEFQPLFVFNNEEQAKDMEICLILYENGANNDVGYDLTINNEYNKIVGDAYLSISGELKGPLNITWKNIPPKELVKAVKEGLTTTEIMVRFGVEHIQTIHKRLRAYGISIKGTGRQFDARAFVLKPVIEEAILKGLSIKGLFQLARDNGVYIFDKYKNKINYLRKICDYIWGKMLKHIPVNRSGFKSLSLSRLRKVILARKMFEYTSDLRYNRIAKVIEDMEAQGYVFRYKKEAGKIFTWYFGEGYGSVQNNLLRTILGDYLKQENPELSNREISELLGLEANYQNTKIVLDMIYRVFGALRGKVPRDLEKIKELIRSNKI